MKLTRCEKSHYYDADKYDSCPHCAKNASKDPTLQTKSQKNAVLAGTVVVPQALEEQNVKTEAVHTVGEAQLNVTVSNVDPIELTEAPNAAVFAAREATFGDVSGGLRAAIDSAKGAQDSEDSKTMAFYDIANTNPVVGWLVCVKGIYMGESFSLRAGRNAIGRSLKMDVALAKELSVSRDRHAVIIYEPKKRKFYIQAGDCSGLSYLNDELIMAPSELKDFDKLQFGKGEFLFREFCGERFTWDDYTD